MQMLRRNHDVLMKDIIRLVLKCKIMIIHFALILTFALIFIYCVTNQSKLIPNLTGTIQIMIYSKNQHHITVKALAILVTRTTQITEAVLIKRVHTHLVRNHLYSSHHSTRLNDHTTHITSLFH